MRRVVSPGVNPQRVMFELCRSEGRVVSDRESVGRREREETYSERSVKTSRVYFGVMYEDGVVMKFLFRVHEMDFPHGASLEEGHLFFSSFFFWISMI